MQFLGQLFVILQKWTRLVGRHLLHEVGQRLAPKRQATGEQLVEHDAQAEDVATAVDPVPFAAGLFGRHVGGRARIIRSLADIFFSQGQSEIDDVRLAVVADQDVGRLHITMNEPLFVGIVQRVGDSGDQLDGFPVLEPVLLDLRGEIGPLDVFRHHVTGAVIRAPGIMHRNDVGMIEIGDGAGFGEIRLGIFGLRDQPGVRHLDGDRPVQLLILRQIDEAEAPFAEQLFDPVTPDPPRACSERTFDCQDVIPKVIVRHIVGIRLAHVGSRFLRKAGGSHNCLEKQLILSG